MKKPSSTMSTLAKMRASSSTKKFKAVHGQDDIMKPHFKPAKLVRSTPKLSVMQLLKLADAKKKELVKELAVRKLGTLELPANTKTIPTSTVSYRIQTYSKHNKHIHNVSVFLVDGNPFSEHSHVIVDCSCSDHAYRSEYNLAKRGNAFMWRCNGEAPLVNTKLQICKHTHLALRYMVRQSRYGVLPRKSHLRKQISLVRGT